MAFSISIELYLDIDERCAINSPAGTAKTALIQLHELAFKSAYSSNQFVSAVMRCDAMMEFPCFVLQIAPIIADKRDNPFKIQNINIEIIRFYANATPFLHPPIRRHAFDGAVIIRMASFSS